MLHHEWHCSTMTPILNRLTAQKKASELEYYKKNYLEIEDARVKTKHLFCVDLVSCIVFHRTFRAQPHR